MSSPVGGFNYTGIFVSNTCDRVPHQVPSTTCTHPQDVTQPCSSCMNLPNGVRNSPICGWRHGAWKRRRGRKWLCFHSSIFLVSSFILFVLLFLYGREDNLQAHNICLRPLMLILLIFGLQDIYIYIYNVGKSGVSCKREGQSFWGCIFVCVCIHVYMSLHLLMYIYVNICTHNKFQKWMSLSLETASLYFNVYIYVYVDSHI